MPRLPDEIFPEESYDDASGEFNEAFDFEPTFSQRVYLNEEGTLWADVFSTQDYDQPFTDAITELENFISEGRFEIDFVSENPQQYPTIPDEFDYGNPNVRGPFIDTSHVSEFLKVTGFGKTADVFYDAENDEFWIDIYPE